MSQISFGQTGLAEVGIADGTEAATILVKDINSGN